MTESNSKCPRCHKEHAQGSPECADGKAGPDNSAACPAGTTGDKTAHLAAEAARDFSPPDQLIGKLFAEKYDVISLLGEGGMCKVYKARHRFMKRTVALKLLHENATKDTVAKARFQQEAEAASALNHQNVVTVHDFGFTPADQAFFVMDCLQGQTLEDIMLASKPNLPLARAIDLFTQACDGLDHAHRKGIVHRDIKPSNLVVIKQEDGSDLVKIVDFGIAKVTAPLEDGEKPRQLTQTGEVFGTPAYMSPEQCCGKPLDGRSDIYSFGCLMYEALSGQPPLMGETFINTVVKHINERPKSFAEVAPQCKVPAHIEAVVMKCLEKDPEARYASALELKQALYDAAFASGVEGLRFGAVPEPKSTGTASGAQRVSLSEQMVTRRWRLSFTLTLSAMVLILGGVSSWVFCYPGPDDDKGTPFLKLLWVHHIARADDFMRQQKYDEATREFEKARDICRNFGDGHIRLESVLNKLGEAYGLAQDYKDQEAVNNQLTQLVSERVYNEFDLLMALMNKWQQPSSSSTGNEELALQAAAFADRILHCADKLSIRSREKQEKLLKKAIVTYDGMESRDWKYCVLFRISLGDCYRKQQRFGELRAVLNEAIKSCPDKPSSSGGWRAKIQASMLLGQLDSNEAADVALFDHARSELETVLAWVRTYLPQDKELLREALGSLVTADRLYHTKEYDDKAAAFEKEARALGT